MQNPLSGNKLVASPIQQQFWLLHQLNPESPVYNMASVFQLDGNLQIDRLEKCINTLYRKIDILRTTFENQDGILYQIQHPFEPVHLIRVSYPDDEWEEQTVIEKIRDDAACPFDLERGPLVRFRIYCAEGDRTYFLITMHHIISDLRSSDIFGEHLSMLYNDEECAENAIFETVNYAEYAVRLNEWLATKKSSEMVSYWKTTLSESVGHVNLPYDNPHPSHRTLAGRAVPVTFNALLTEKIRTFCSQDPFITTLLTLLSAYAVLLYRFSGQKKIRIGVPFANRRKNDVKNTIGCFVNMLPIVATMDETTTFSGLLEQIRNNLIDAQKNQDIPLFEVDKAVASRHNPIFQTGFTLSHPMMLSFNGVKIKPLYLHAGGSQMDLFGSFWESDAGIQGFMEYDSAVFDESTVHYISECFLQVLESVIGNPPGLIDHVPLSAYEEPSLPAGHEQYDDEERACQTLIEMFVSQVVNTPDAAAVFYEENMVTYHDLNLRANHLSLYLRVRGITLNSVVVVFMNSSIEAVVSFLGVLKTAPTIVLLDPADSPEHITEILMQTLPALILTQQKHVQCLPPINVPILCVDSEWDAFIAKNDSLTVPENSGNECAIITFTSGTLGHPKAVTVPYQNLYNKIIWMRKSFPIQQSTKILHKTMLGYHTWFQEIVWVLTSGAQLVISGSHSIDDRHSDSTVINEKKVTDIICTPMQLLNLMLRARVTSYACIRRVFCSGELLMPQIVDRFFLNFKAQLINLYGLAEAAGAVYCWEYSGENGDRHDKPLGYCTEKTKFHVLNKSRQMVPWGTPGELYISGDINCRGYLNQPRINDQFFIPSLNISGNIVKNLVYTGDVVRLHSDKTFDFVSRSEEMAMVFGYPVDFSEIEAVIARVPGVDFCTVLINSRKNNSSNTFTAYIVSKCKSAERSDLVAEVKRVLVLYLPAYKHPSGFVITEEIPITIYGKIDRGEISKLEFEKETQKYNRISDYTEDEARIASVWKKLLNVERVPVDLSFFDASGTSLLAVQLAQELQKIYNRKVPVAHIFQYPTIRDFATLVGKNGVDLQGYAIENKSKRGRDYINNDEIAVVGLSCRFPGADTVDEYWRMLQDGREGILFFDDDKIPPSIDVNFRKSEFYVRAKGIINEFEYFDADFFGMTHLIAESTDPQIRLFLEHSYHALENAGYTFEKGKHSVGVFAGMGRSLYLRFNILPQPEVVERIGELQLELGHEKDHLPTRVSHTFDLTGPSISVNTACSTSLVSIIMACQAIQRGDCTMALAGGSNIAFPLYRGHLHQEGAFFSRDGHCRPFDSEASGTTFSDGVGVVVLKKLSQALADNNTIYAVVKAGAINNDGAKKVSYTAPGVDGQVAVITSALKDAGINADNISYVEAHGTGTPLGDPIEIEALTQAYRQYTGRNQYCAIGSVKGNIGHTSVAAGVAGFIKTVLMLHYKRMVPSLHFIKANPAIDFENSPFYVNTAHLPWKTNGMPRCAAVTSLGFGGTNAHCILEEAPERNISRSSRKWQLLPFSANSPEALGRIVGQFGSYIANADSDVLADAAFTLQKGRKRFPYRFSTVCQSGAQASELLAKTVPSTRIPAVSSRSVSVAFMFPGQGSQYINMGKIIYETEMVYRDAFDRCAEAVRMEHYDDIRSVVFSDDTEEVRERLKNTYYAQTSIFATEYALSQLWLSWGVRPSILLGHSVGEFCAACIAGCMSLEDAARLVAARGMLMGKCDPGAMLSVRLSEGEVLPLLTDGLSVAAVNSPKLCVVSGTFDAIKNFEEVCASREFACRRLHTSHAFHSAMMEPAVEEFTDIVRKVNLMPPGLPIMSTVNNRLLTDQLAIDPHYWARHMRETVRFSDAIAFLLASNPDTVFLEVGPKDTCCILTRQQIRDSNRQIVLSSLGDGNVPESEDFELVTALGKLWMSGYEPDWNTYKSDEQRFIISLPSYPFDKKRHWIDDVSIKYQQKSEEITLPTDSVDLIQKADLKNEVETATEPSTIASEHQGIPTVKKIVAGALGVSVLALDGSMTFLELGMDSLFLTQLSQRIKLDFKVTVSMRQLMREYTTVDKLTDFISKESIKYG